MKNQKIRSMKVHEQSGYNYKATPTIILKGQWLKEMGFEIMESWGAAGGVNTSSFCRAWFESAIRWKYADLVWTYLESGTISTDGGKTLETRTDFGDGGGSAYYYCWNNR